jgi:hypothetical protein
MVEAGHGRLMEVRRDTLDRPLDLEELRMVLQKGGGNEASGRDGIGWALLIEKAGKSQYHPNPVWLEDQVWQQQILGSLRVILTNTGL